MARPSTPVIRNIEHVRLKDSKTGEALDDVRKHLGNLQDQLIAALARITALEKG